jgi:hypothetical protein
MGALLEYVEHMLQAVLWPAVYEVLLPGSVCKLYLDVEYNRELNLGRTLAGDDAVLAHMQLLLQRASPHALPDCQLHAMQLAARTPCGGDEPNMKQHVLDAQHQLHLDMPSALVHSASGRTSMTDASAYNKHKQFRLACSTKYSQCRPLLPAAMTSVFTHPNSEDAAAVQHWVTETLLTVAFDAEHQCSKQPAPTHHGAPQHALPDCQLHAMQLGARVTPCDGDEPKRGCVGPFPDLEEALCTQYNSTILRCRRDKLNAMAPHLHYYLLD